MKLTKLFFAAFIVLSANATFAQVVPAGPVSASHLVNINIPEVALLDLKVASGTTEITLNGTAPTVAGDAMNFDNATDSSIWMNYSSIVKGNFSRKIFVALSDDVPNGLKLTVVASELSTGGAGTLGTASGELTLSTAEQDIVTGIGSTYSGNGSSKGRNLTYKLNFADTDTPNYAALRFLDAVPLTVTYTLTDNL
ncbi:MAG: hypothetical protein ACYCZ2_17695 [Lutibacter sp.]